MDLGDVSDTHCRLCRTKSELPSQNRFLDSESFQYCRNCCFRNQTLARLTSIPLQTSLQSLNSDVFNQLKEPPVSKQSSMGPSRTRKCSEKIPGIGNSYIGDKINNIENRSYLFDQDEDDELIGIWIDRPNKETQFMYMGCFPITILGFDQQDTKLLSETTSKLLGEVTLLPSLDTNVVEDPGEITSTKGQLFLIELYFKHHHFSYPVLDRETIIDSFARNALSKVLLYSICCISYYYILFDHPNSKRVLGDELTSLDLVTVIKHFEMQAQFHLNKCFHHADIQTVQALILLSENPTNPVTSPKVWLYSGMATRMAMELKLNRASNNNSRLSYKEKETRKLIWWGCFMLDTFYSIIMSRPLSIQLSQCDTEYPELTNNSKTTNLFVHSIKISVIASKINMLVTSVKLNSSLEDRKNRALDCISLLKSWYQDFLRISKLPTSSHSDETQTRDLSENLYLNNTEDMIIYNYYYYLLMITELIYICDNSFKVLNPEDINRVNPYCLKIIRYFSENISLNIISTPSKVYSIFYCCVVCIYNLKLIFKTRDCHESATIEALIFWYKNLASCYCIMLKIQSNINIYTNNGITNKNRDFSNILNANGFVALSLSVGLSKQLPIPLDKIDSLADPEFLRNFQISNP